MMKSYYLTSRYYEFCKSLFLNHKQHQQERPIKNLSSNLRGAVYREVDTLSSQCKLPSLQAVLPKRRRRRRRWGRNAITEVLPAHYGHDRKVFALRISINLHVISEAPELQSLIFSYISVTRIHRLDICHAAEHIGMGTHVSRL